MIEMTVGKNEAGQRLLKALRKTLKAGTDGFFYKALRKKTISLNGKKAKGDEILAEGDVIRFYLPDEVYDGLRGVEKKIREVPHGFPKITVLCEDDDVLVFVKPQGVLSQNAEENDYSMNDWVIRYASERRSFAGGSCRPSIVNRLDRNTYGIMAAGLSVKGLQTLSELFRDRSIEKRYHVIVRGKTEESALLAGFLLKDEKSNTVRVFDKPTENAKEIRTSYERVCYDPALDLSLLKVDLLTGRSHQIRAHLAHAGYPVLGDEKYGDRALNKKFGVFMQCLACTEIAFPECDLPAVSGKRFSIPVPANWILQGE